MAALDYLDAGWPGVIPISVTADGKRPLVKGFTGHDGAYPDRAQVEEWIREYPRASIGLRLPTTILGLDVDCYEDKAGRESLALLIGRFGPLQPTWISTSRTDGSGIRLFRVPDSNAYQANPEPGIETIRACHRFVTVAPTRHGREGHPPYVWVDPERRERRDYIPSPEELTTLAAPWAVGLPGAMVGSRARVTDPQAATGFLSGRDDPCPVVAATYSAWRRTVKAAGANGGAYDAARDGVHALLGDAEQGHRGAGRAVVSLGLVYITAVSDRRAASVARAEFHRHATGEVEKRRIPQPQKGSGCKACREAEALNGWSVRRA